jgi:hypothetical protein
VLVERDRLYRLQEFADGFGVTLRSVQRWVAKGLLPTRKVGGVVVVLGRDLLESLPVNEPEPAEPKPRRRRKPKAKPEGDA